MKYIGIYRDKNISGAPERMHPIAARARSAVLLDARLTLAGHSAKNDYQSFY